MKKQIQSYLDDKEYKALKKIADSRGLSFASVVREILMQYIYERK